MEQSPDHILRTITCTHCQEKQTVRTLVQPGVRFIRPQTVKCVSCENHFEVVLPDEIVGGPYK